ncbi:helix-turn-helix transcriptional regulator [uncultured Pontibacter sp.]|uniref:helix-turn-helix transcriptional regulator n=1 Tax=uncultured Pontibacter sp. TaxID=453356 RepID=UPI0026217484|nr:helix-turn-helix transcriptional regulator [uncultured Pontibacter sp.]
MVERIKVLMEYKGLTSTQFADTVEVPRAVISHILSGRNKPSLEVITKIVAAFPEVSVNWMLLGEGEMLKALAPPVAPVSDVLKEPLLPSDKQPTAPAKPVDNDKVQNKSIPDSAAAASTHQDKAIEQIVVFYTDKTFTAYKP